DNNLKSSAQQSSSISVCHCTSTDCVDSVCNQDTGECVDTPKQNSTPCPDTDGDPCTTSGCDSNGVCDQRHIVCVTTTTVTTSTTETTTTTSTTETTTTTSTTSTTTTMPGICVGSGACRIDIDGQSFCDETKGQACSLGLAVAVVANTNRSSSASTRT